MVLYNVTKCAGLVARAIPGFFSTGGQERPQQEGPHLIQRGHSYIVYLFYM